MPLRIAGYSSFDEAAETLKGPHSLRKQKKPRAIARGFFCFTMGRWSYLDLPHIGGLGAFLALSHFKGNAIAFSEGFEAFALDFGKVNENVRTVVLLDETKTFCVVEPLDSTFSHFLCSMFPEGTF